MSEKDTVKEKLKKNISNKDTTSKTNIVLFKFLDLKKSANITVSDYNLFNYNFITKSLFDLNPNLNNFKKKESEYIIQNFSLNTMKYINIDIPSSERLFQENFYNEFIEDYETSFANFCEIDKNLFIKAFANKKYMPQIDKFGTISISIKNILEVLKNYSQFLKLKIRRRFTKKYKKKKLFKTLKNVDLNQLKQQNSGKDGLKLLSLKKNLKISVKKLNNNINSAEKENIQNGNINYNINSNNLLSNISNILSNDNIFSNNIIKSSIFKFPPPSNNMISSPDNFFSFSIHDQNFFSSNNINNLNNINQPQLSNNINQNNQFLNKKRTFTPYIPYTPYYGNVNPNLTQSNKKNNNNSNNNNSNNNPTNINIQTPLYNYNLISPQLFNSYKNFLTPTSIHLSQNEASPYINIANDRFNFNNIRSTFFGNMNNINNQSPIINNNNIYINPNILNINNYAKDDNINNANQNDNNNINIMNSQNDKNNNDKK